MIILLKRIYAMKSSNCFVIALLSVLLISPINLHATYNPQIGRFLQQDPLGTRPMIVHTSGGPQYIGTQGPFVPNPNNETNSLSQYFDGMNLYEYAKSNPIMLTDPLGGCSSKQENMLNHKADELKKLLASKCQKCDCMHVHECKKDAGQIASAIKNTIKDNYGKGKNTSSHARGGYLCWRWAEVFKHSSDKAKAKHISSYIKAAGNDNARSSWIAAGRPSSGYLHHYYLELTVGHDRSKKECKVVLDDGWINPSDTDDWIHDHKDVDNWYNDPADPWTPTIPTIPPLPTWQPPMTPCGP